MRIEYYCNLNVSTLHVVLMSFLRLLKIRPVIVLFLRDYPRSDCYAISDYLQESDLRKIGRHLRELQRMAVIRKEETEHEDLYLTTEHADGYLYFELAKACSKLDPSYSKFMLANPSGSAGWKRMELEMLFGSSEGKRKPEPMKTEWELFFDLASLELNRIKEELPLSPQTKQQKDRSPGGMVS